MNALGLSERALISVTGIPNASFRAARQEGVLEGSLSLRHVHTLAEALGLTTSDLLALSHQSTEPPEPSALDDAAHLIPVLHEVAKTVAVDHVARSLGWERARLQAALDAIPTALSGTGLRLHHSNGSVKIVPAAPTDARIKTALRRVRTLGSGLNATEAGVLSRIINGHNVLDRMPSNATRVAVGSLKNMGCIALNDDAVFEPTADLQLALPDL